MKPKYSAQPSFPYLTAGLFRAVPLWLYFKQTLSRETWRQDVAQQLTTSISSDDATLISTWLSTQKHFDSLHLNSYWLVMLVGAIFGLTTMLGALNYSGSAPVNVWLLLGIFCFLPLLMTLVAMISWINTRKAQPLPPGLWARFLSRSLMNTLSGQPNLISVHSRLLTPWCMWKAQGMALGFQVSTIGTFITVLIFKDVAFGWSSTIIQDDSGMPTFFSTLALPWSWLIDIPSAELIAQSRFYRGDDSFDAAMLSQWWSYILMAMICYGLLPRLLLSMWMRSGVKTLLLDDIHGSGVIERFLNAARYREMSEDGSCDNVEKQASKDAQVSPTQTITATDDIFTDAHVIAWQCSPEQINTLISLGKSDWESDERWLKEHAPNWDHAVAIVMNIEQTPTAELSDILELIYSLNSELVVALHLIQTESMNDPRQQGQIKSWQYFSAKHNTVLNIMECPDREFGEKGKGCE